MFNPNLKTNQKIDNNELCEIFKCSPQGGMRKSNSTDSLVLVLNHIKSIYDDREEGETFYYTGMGTVGDQSLDFMQNKTLSESNSNGVSVFLFQVFEDKIYTFTGAVKLSAAPYQENQLDVKLNERKVWVFPLQLNKK